MKCPGCSSKQSKDVTTVFDDEKWFKCLRCGIRHPEERKRKDAAARGFVIATAISLVALLITVAVVLVW